MAIQSSFQCECGRKMPRMKNTRDQLTPTNEKGFVYGAPAWDNIPGDAIMQGWTCNCGKIHEFIQAPRGHPYANVRRTS